MHVYAEVASFCSLFFFCTSQDTEQLVRYRKEEQKHIIIKIKTNNNKKNRERRFNSLSRRREGNRPINKRKTPYTKKIKHKKQRQANKKKS